MTTSRNVRETLKSWVLSTSHTDTSKIDRTFFGRKLDGLIARSASFVTAGRPGDPGGACWRTAWRALVGPSLLCSSFDVDDGSQGSSNRASAAVQPPPFLRTFQKAKVRHGSPWFAMVSCVACDWLVGTWVWDIWRLILRTPYWIPNIGPAKENRKAYGVRSTLK